jgi:hypothetical protein
VKLPPEEPAAGPWRVEPVGAVAATLAGPPPAPDGRPVIVAAGEMSPADFDFWMAEGFPFVAADRPWEWADLLVAGTRRSPTTPHRAGRGYTTMTSFPRA